MGFADAVKSGFGQYADFSGRARRSEYWFFVLAYLGSLIVASIIMGASSVVGGALLLIVVLAFTVPAVALSTRRLHDTGQTGWWQLISIVAIFFYVQDSQGDNKYGSSPKAVAGEKAPLLGR